MTNIHASSSARAYVATFSIIAAILSAEASFAAPITPKNAPTALSADACAGLCTSQLYEEYFSCKEKQYAGVIERAKHFGDVAINAGSCAYKNGDFEIARSFGDMSFTDHPMVWAVLKSTPGKGGSAHRMFIAEVASEKLGDMGKAAAYKNLGLKYAKNSGQCEGAKDLETCAQGYRDDIRRILGESTGKGGGKLADPAKIYDAFEAFCGKHQYFSVDALSCACSDGFKPELKGAKNCILDIPNSFDLDSAINLQLAVENMAPNTYLKTKIKNKKEGDIDIGVIKQPTGKVLFTQDAEEYFTDWNREFHPSLLNRAADAWETLGEIPDNLLDWGFHTKWKDDEEGEYKELQWQISNEVLENYKKELKDEKLTFEKFRKKTEQYTGYAEWLVAFKELHDSIEETDMNFSDFTQDQMESLFESLKNYGATFPGAAIEKFVSEATIEAFSKPVIYYIGERRRGLTQKEIAEKNPEELDVFVNESVRLTFGEAVIDKYEEAYQRYLLAREFDRKK